MNYIYCGAHLSLLYAIYFRQLKHKITVISYNDDILKFCLSQNIDIIVTNYISPATTSINKIIIQKNKLNEIIHGIDDVTDSTFILTGKTKGLDSYYIAKELSKKGLEIYYINTTGFEFNRYKRRWYKPIFFKGDVFRVFFKIIMDIDLVYFSGAGIPRLGVDENYFQKYSIHDYPIGMSHEDLILEVAKKSKFKSKMYDNLIIDQGSLVNIIHPESLIKILKQLHESPLHFSLKKHPTRVNVQKQRSISHYDILQDWEEIPKYIPIELIFNSIQKNIISIYSASLYTASQFNHLKAISLLDLVDWYNDSFKNEIRNMLIEKSHNKIIFPKNFDELKKILTSS